MPVTAIVVDNGMYGTIRMHQEREYPSRISATALKKATRSGKPAIIHPKVDPEAITPSTTPGAIRVEAKAGGAP